MLTEVQPGKSPRGQRQPSVGRRRIRKLGRTIFYLLLIASPVAAGCRPVWALGVFGSAWLAWFMLFLLPQFYRRGVGGRPWPALGLAAVGLWAVIQGLAPHAPYSGVQWPPEGALSVAPWASLQQGAVFLVSAVIFTGAAWLVDSSERIRALLLAIALGGALFATVALALATSDGQVLTGAAPYLPEFHTANTAVRATYSNQDRFAALLLLTLPCIVGLWVSLHFFSWRRDGPPTLRAIGRDYRLTISYTLYWIGISITLGALILTGCRTTAIVCGAAALVLAAIFGRRALFRRRGAIAVLAMTVLLILQQVMFGFDPVASRFANLDVSWDTRWRGWTYAVELIGRRPFFGWGAGAFGDAVPHLPTYSETLLWNHAHNQYLEYAAGLGLPVALALLAGLVWWGHEVLSAMRHLRSRRRMYVIAILWAVCALLVVGLVDVPFYEPATLWTLVALMGAGWGVSARPNEPLSPDEPPPSLLSWQEAHKAESAAPFRPTHRLPAWAVFGLMLPLGTAGLALTALLAVDGLHEVRVRTVLNPLRPLSPTDEHWNGLLDTRLASRWNARPLQLAAMIGLERQLGGPISPADQLFDPPLFAAGVAPSRLESAYRIRTNLMHAIQIEPLNGNLYFQLALLDFLQRQPPAARAPELLPGLHEDLLSRILQRLEPAAADPAPPLPGSANAAPPPTRDELIARIKAYPETDVIQAAIAEQVVLPRELADWRIQCIRHLTVASDYSRGFTRMQLFCALLRLHLWRDQGTGDSELEHALSELHTAFAAQPNTMRLALPLLFYFRIPHPAIDQTVPDTPAGHTLAAGLYRQWDFLADAMRHYNQAGNSPEIALNKGGLLMQMDDVAGAVEQFQKYIDSPPADDRANRAGRIFAEWRNTAPEDALRFWQAQAEKYPKEKCWPLFLGNAYARINDRAHAYEFLTQAIDTNDSEGLRLRLASLAPGPESRLQHLRKALTYHPDNLYARADLILILKEKGDTSYQAERDQLRQSVRNLGPEVKFQDLPEVVQRALGAP